MGRGSEHYFSKGIQMTGVHTYTLTIREMQIKTTMRYHLKPVRMAIIKKKRKKEKSSVGNNVEKKETLYTVGRIIRWYSHNSK